MLLSIKTKLKLSQAQSVVMSKHAGIARFTYNWGLIPPVNQLQYHERLIVGL
jgi:hypothetical protein